MKYFVLLVVVLISLFSIDSRSDRFPGGEPGDQCRAGNPDIEDCGEDMTCETVGYENDPDRPGYAYPIYDCVALSHASTHIENYFNSLLAVHALNLYSLKPEFVL